MLGFNVDPLFSHVLDGLILVDLTQTDQRILDRYMGKEGTESFLNTHQDHQVKSGQGEMSSRFAA